MGNTFGKDAVETVKTASELKTQPPPSKFNVRSCIRNILINFPGFSLAKASPTSASNLNGMAKTEDEGKPLESSGGLIIYLFIFIQFDLSLLLSYCCLVFGS